jgi:hypothetical protein
VDKSHALFSSQSEINAEERLAEAGGKSSGWQTGSKGKMIVFEREISHVT